jgi:hypothetical protein
MVKLSDFGLVELSKGEYVSPTMMLTNKYIFGNWIQLRMCGDYCPMNKDTRLDKYAMPLPEEIFDTLKQAKVFSILDLRYGYYQLPLKEGDKINITFWGINPHGKDCLY